MVHYTNKKPYLMHLILLLYNYGIIDSESINIINLLKEKVISVEGSLSMEYFGIIMI